MTHLNNNEYQKSGVDYSIMEPFKQAMIATGKKTLDFPNKREVYVSENVMHAHGAVFEYRGTFPHMWCHTQEDLGNKNWIAEWMYQNEGTGKTYYDAIAKDTALMVVNDVIAQGAMPVVFTDQIEAGNSEWFADKKRNEDLAKGFLEVCHEAGMALPAGESATLKYLINPAPPVKVAPSLSGSVAGIIAPKNRLITGEKLQIGDHIIGVTSSGLHSNGISLVINRALKLPDKFLTKLPNGNTLGAESLIPTRCYVSLIEALLNAQIDVHALLPSTGDGLGKLAFDHRMFNYRIHTWINNIPPLFLFMKELGVSMRDCLKTFNWGIGYYIFADAYAVDKILNIGKSIGYELLDLGIVEEGQRQVIFEPENIILPSPGRL